jgi:hypothetical protein
LPVQHGSVSAPQPPQLPPMQALPLGHEVPCPRQVLLVQQPPSLQALPLQQGSPALPHGVHVPAEHAASASAQMLPPQHGCPFAPHGPHMLLKPQELPASHCRPSQHGSPGAPHAIGPASAVAPPLPFVAPPDDLPALPPEPRRPPVPAPPLPEPPLPVGPPSAAVAPIEPSASSPPSG